MGIRTIVLGVMLAMFFVAAGCNCPCNGKSACTMPESGVTVEAASETAVR